jgi:hypothetical protein
MKIVSFLLSCPWKDARETRIQALQHFESPRMVRFVDRGAQI